MRRFCGPVLLRVLQRWVLPAQAHSRMVWDNKLRDGNSTSVVCASSASLIERVVKVLPVAQAMIIWPLASGFYSCAQQTPIPKSEYDLTVYSEGFILCGIMLLHLKKSINQQDNPFSRENFVRQIDNSKANLKPAWLHCEWCCLNFTCKMKSSTVKLRSPINLIIISEGFLKLSEFSIATKK